MNIQEMHNAHTEHWHDKEGLKFGLKAMSWYGWGSATGAGFLLLSIGGFLYLLHLASLIS